MFALFLTAVGEGSAVSAGRPDGPWCSSHPLLLTYLYEGGEQKVS